MKGTCQSCVDQMMAYRGQVDICCLLCALRFSGVAFQVVNPSEQNARVL